MKLEAKIKKQLSSFQLDLHIQADSSAIVIWGASGAGKTQTLNALAGFSRPDSGRIMLGDDLFFDAATGIHVPPQRRRCGYLFQEHALFPHMTVKENLNFAAGFSRQSSRQKTKELLSLFELEELADQRPAQLSGGQQQRAALARAMVIQPRMLLLDEPTQGLDGRLKRSFFQLLRETGQRSETLILLVTHDLDECFEIAEHVCLLDKGKVLQSGPKESVFAKPATIEVAKSLGIFNVIPAEIESLDPGRNSSRIRMLGASWNGTYFPGHLLGDQGFAVFRETSLRLSKAASDVALQIDGVKPYSRGVRIELEGGVNSVLSETEARDLRPGSAIRVHIMPGDIVFLSK